MTGVRTQTVDSIGLIELDEPASRNALSSVIRAGVRAALDRFIAEDLRAVVITGRGSAFCAGGDLKTMPADAATGAVYIQEIMDWFEMVERYPLPTVAAVNGAAVGGGAELALACDLVVAADRAILGFPETQVGLMAPFAAARLPGLLPRAVAKELTLTGRVLSADEAAGLGLVNRVVPLDELLPAAYQLAGRIVERSELASRITKELMNEREVSADRAARATAPLFANADTRRRIQAFVDRTASTSTSRGVSS